MANRLVPSKYLIRLTAGCVAVVTTGALTLVTHDGAASEVAQGVPASTGTAESTPAGAGSSTPDTSTSPIVDASTSPSAGVGSNPTPGPARPPDAPTNLRVVSVEPAQARLCWNAAARADAYTLYYRDSTLGEAFTRMPYPIHDTCYTVQLMRGGHTYAFRIRGGSAAGEGPESNIATGVAPGESLPPAPTGLTATAGNGQARVCWKAAAHADGYALFYRDVTKGQAFTRMPYPVNDTCYTMVKMINGHTYAVKVHGGNLAGEGPDSAEVRVTPHS